MRFVISCAHAGRQAFSSPSTTTQEQSPLQWGSGSSSIGSKSSRTGIIGAPHSELSIIQTQIVLKLHSVCLTLMNIRLDYCIFYCFALKLHHVRNMEVSAMSDLKKTLPHGHLKSNVGDNASLTDFA